MVCYISLNEALYSLLNKRKGSPIYLGCYTACTVCKTEVNDRALSGLINQIKLGPVISYTEEKGALYGLLN